MCVCAHWDTRLIVFFFASVYFFLHQTLVFVFYQFISVCALRGEGVHFGLTDGTGGKEGSEFGESHYPDRFIAVGQFLSKCSAPLPFAIFIVVDINTIYFPWKTC